jgi:hypothetical protein
MIIITKAFRCQSNNPQKTLLVVVVAVAAVISPVCSSCSSSR